MDSAELRNCVVGGRYFVISRMVLCKHWESLHSIVLALRGFRASSRAKGVTNQNTVIYDLIAHLMTL